ncbi:uncharacterized protein N7482_004361 [Penicillium canariense]|uniref:Alpha/beta hydrolase fold-3 domain-containing protein n=1 Tax=Penicillium canariense TaxID=189055 RepID=A0A9W9ICA6_9EURO|nr:uncharacterized protein N7482_004361 [Penicillium canariense]KAJ5168767.1 hypothetical protein N7482_004361 [Penicillium canariense]
MRLMHQSRRLVLPRSRNLGFLYAAYYHVRFISKSSKWVDDSFCLPVGGNGAVSLSVTRPAPSSLPVQSQSRAPGPNVILYLPAGTMFQGRAGAVQRGGGSDVQVAARERKIDTADFTGLSPQHALATMTSATVVTVNYRLGEVADAVSWDEEAAPNTPEKLPLSAPEPPTKGAQSSYFTYPTPIHDTLAAFDWIQTHLQPAQLGVVGTHIGGSLAIMLALTEAQSVKAVAAIDPICDWPGLDEYCTPEPIGLTESAGATITSQSPARLIKPKRSSKKGASRATAPPDLVSLLRAREALFASPERYFDAFASPILFLRSAGCDVPRAFPQYLTGPEYPVPVLKRTPKVTAAEQHDAPDGSLWNRDIYPAADAEDADLGEVTVVRRRKALSRWPPFGLDYGSGGGSWSGGGTGVQRLQVTLPWVRIFAEGETVLADQGGGDGVCFAAGGFGERRVTFERVTGNEPSGKEVGGWIGGIFAGSIRDD